MRKAIAHQCDTSIAQRIEPGFASCMFNAPRFASRPYPFAVQP
jgi:hypothetical protein